MPKIKDLPTISIDPPEGAIVLVEPYLFYYKKKNVRTHHDPKAKILLKAIVFVTSSDFRKGDSYTPHRICVSRHQMDIDLDDPNALSEFTNGVEVVEKLKESLEEVEL